jgi:ABC-2 type transport system permease protein
MKKFLKVLQARNKEFIRDREALGWNLAFPFLVIFGFAFMFSGGNDTLFKVGVHPNLDMNLGERRSVSTDNFLNTKYIQFIPSLELDETLEKLKRHQLDMVISLRDGEKYWINESSPKGYLLEKLLVSHEGTPAQQRQTVEGGEIRYVDWLISGLLAMNMMFSALFGVGYVIVRYRKIGVLRRLKATPLSALTFLSAQIVSRYLLIIGSTIVVYIGAHAFIHFRMAGSYFDLFIVMSLGAICLITLGLLIAARTASEEFAGGILNLISWPMMFLSGVWFSLEGANPWVKKLALAFPLTHVIDAARSIMTEGATLVAVQWNVFALIGMTALFLMIGSLTFRWE